MRRRICRLGLIFLLFGAGAAMAETDPRAALERSIRNRDIQTELPATGAKTPPVSWNWSLSPDLGRVLLWGAVIAGVIVIGWSMRDAIPAFDRSRRLVASEDGAKRPVARDGLNQAQAEADELAAQGRYAEAMHLLLLRAVAELRAALGLSFADSLTSREILRRAPLSDGGRGSLARIVGDVERTHFGEDAADGEAYAACRGEFDALRNSLRAATA